MAQTTLQVLNAVGDVKSIDVWSLSAGVLRQAAVIGSPSADTAVAEVKNGPMAAGVYALVTRVAPIGLPYHRVAAASTNAVSIKGSAGAVALVSCFSNAAYPVFVKFYDLATAPNPASDTPVWTVGIQAGLTRDVAPPPGVAFTLGIAMAIVKGIADNNNVAVAAGDCVVDVFRE